MMKNVMILVLLSVCVFAVESRNTQQKLETKEVLKKGPTVSPVKVMEKKHYPMKMKEYPRGAIATH